MSDLAIRNMQNAYRSAGIRPTSRILVFVAESNQILTVGDVQVWLTSRRVYVLSCISSCFTIINIFIMKSRLGIRQLTMGKNNYLTILKIYAIIFSKQ